MSVALELPDCWGIDCNTKITAARAKAIKQARIVGHGGEFPILWVARYCPLPGNAAGGDLDTEEVKVLEGEGLPFFVVQHCRGPSPWTASAEQGQKDGEHAAMYCAGIGVAENVCVGLDLENLRNPGPDVFAHADAWSDEVDAAKYSPSDYIGFNSGLSADDHFRLPRFHRYWGAAGSWNVSKRGICCRQYPTMQLAGLDFPVDPDRAAPDLMGGRLIVHAPDGFAFPSQAAA